MVSQKKSFLSRLFKPIAFDEAPPKEETPPEPKEKDDGAYPRPATTEVSVQYSAKGKSGTSIFGGFYDEEYLRVLRGSDAVEIYDKMRRSDAKIAKALNAVKNPIKSATWEVQKEKAADGSQYDEHREFIEHCLFKKMSFGEFLNEALTVIDFGHALFEEVHELVKGDKKYGDYVGLKKLGFRSQKTIFRWDLDKVTGELKHVEQRAYGDIEVDVKIPADFLLIFNINKEGDNYEGISLLRPCYGPWLRKQTYLKLMAIGIEKYAIPTPIGKIPSGKENGTEKTAFINALEIYTSHQANYITLPVGFEITFGQNNFDAQKVQAAITAENAEIVDAFLASFLELGQGGNSGAYALSNDLSDFFLGCLEYLANQVIADKLNNRTIKNLIDMKYGPQDFYPKLRASGISDKAGKELAEIVKTLTDGKIIIPDDQLEDNMRKRYSLPERSLEGQRESNPAPLPGQDPENPDDPEGEEIEESGSEDQGEKEKKPPAPPKSKLSGKKKVELAEKSAKKQIKEAAVDLQVFMSERLMEIGDNMVAKLMKAYRSGSESQRIKAPKEIEGYSAGSYKKALLEELKAIAASARKEALKEVPRKTKNKLSDVKLGADDIVLPATVLKNLSALSDMLSQAQINDLIKKLSFQYSSSLQSTDSEAIIENDLNESIDEYLVSASVEVGAANTASKVVNETRTDVFFDPAVLDDIESFTFINADPVSPICQDLAGRTFDAKDPEAQRYFPPLHHNCKSYLVPNFKGDTNKKIDDIGLKPSDPSLEKYITLSATKK